MYSDAFFLILCLCFGFCTWNIGAALGLPKQSWPRRLISTSVRGKKGMDLSSRSSTASGMAWKKDGQPVPDSNLASEPNTGVSQPAHLHHEFVQAPCCSASVWAGWLSTIYNTTYASSHPCRTLVSCCTACGYPCVGCTLFQGEDIPAATAQGIAHRSAHRQQAAGIQHASHPWSQQSLFPGPRTQQPAQQHHAYSRCSLESAGPLLAVELACEGQLRAGLAQDLVLHPAQALPPLVITELHTPVSAVPCMCFVHKLKVMSTSQPLQCKRIQAPCSPVLLTA